MKGNLMRKFFEFLAQVAVIAALGYAAYQVCRPCWPIVYSERISIGATG